ncbi:MAG: LysM peptidoglycan-binding domain-containing protein [Pseudomonadota bacterium]|nr:LysM peptidoglycan-binding domain-containing protein [Pseudomonadota bacterium]
MSKDLIIRLNNLKDENYIFVGQNLVVSESPENCRSPDGTPQNLCKIWAKA